MVTVAMQSHVGRPIDFGREEEYIYSDINFSIVTQTACNLLKSCRLKAGLSQVDLSRMAGVPQSTISMYERGVREPTVASLQSLLGAMGLDLVASPRSVAPVPSLAFVRAHATHMKELVAARGLSRLTLFGSVARGEATPSSDIDLGVSVPTGVGLYALVGLQRELSDLVGYEVDLVPFEGMKPRVKAQIERDGIEL
jgi:predicted nucleotidyltransferase